MSRERKISNFHTTAVDRISECPDSVLSHILSLLPIKDAVKTEVLSKRWQFLFHFHSSYPMCDDSDEEGTGNFVTFVVKTLFFFLTVPNSRNSGLISDTSRASLRISLSRISGDFWLSRGNCRFMDLSSLVDAVFNCNLVCYGGDRALENEWIQHTVGELLANLAHVKNLALGTLVIEVLAIMEAKGLSSPLLKCKCLTLHTHINKRVLLGIGSTLKGMPNLETLAMTLSLSSAELFDVELEELCSSNEEQYWTAQKWTYKCLTLHLKNVKIAGSWWCCDSNFLAFIQLLLRNARVLQKMAINNPNDYRLEDYFQAAQKLLRFPRSSPDAEVVFCYTLFADKTGTTVSVQFLTLLEDLGRVRDYAWGVGGLGHLYRQLGQASRRNCKQLSGYTSLLEGPSLHGGPTTGSTLVVALGDYHGDHLPLPWDVDDLRPSQVIFDPYTDRRQVVADVVFYTGCIRAMAVLEPYLPDRVLRQFNMVQLVPGPPVSLHPVEVPYTESAEERNAAALAILDNVLGGTRATTSTCPYELRQALVEVQRTLRGPEAAEVSIAGPSSDRYSSGYTRCRRRDRT
ncbi:hypothetical protein RHGRI_037499 [Rhododendron griersonianum]|uniref:F-box domain-containing protein n=1 Tax=Rhododendron griersonianum TaxID=479676 RepID=A0AAV6HRY2_9ERIC|nr:hypothetical protein RHGRI_037499 [Rhododendron griersonianum]